MLSRPTTRPFHRPMLLALSFAVCGVIAAIAAEPVWAADPSPAASPAPLTLLWEGSAPDTTVKTETWWPAIDPVTGDVWVSSAFTDQFWIFGPDGTFKEAWGTPGHGDGQFQLRTNDPHPDAGAAIAFAPDGSFFVVDVGNYRVQHFGADRQLVGSWGSFGTDPGQFTNPKGIATDGTTVYVADDAGSMQAFDTGGTFLRSFDFPFVLFSLSPDGRLITTDPTGVAEFDTNGALVKHLDLHLTAFGMDVAGSGVMLTQPVMDAAGDIYVGVQDDRQALGMFHLSPDGSVLDVWSTGGETMALSPDGSAAYLAWSAGSNTGWPVMRAYALPRS
jgi:hypothetical protein